MFLLNKLGSKTILLKIKNVRRLTIEDLLSKKHFATKCEDMQNLLALGLQDGGKFVAQSLVNSGLCGSIALTPEDYGMVCTGFRLIGFV